MNEFKNTGGAKIGALKSSWPFATLNVTRNKLELNVSLIGKLVFLPGDIISLMPHPGGYKMGAGIKIHHKVPQYKGEVVFWSSKSPAELLRQIEATGFMTNTDAIGHRAQAEVRELQTHGGFAMKTKPLIMLLTLWLAIIIYGAVNMSLTGSLVAFLSAMQLAFVIIILFAVVTLASPYFASGVLKPGYTIADVKKFLIFFIIIAVFMVVGFSISANVI